MKLRKELDLIIIQKVDIGENKELKQITLDRREMKDLVIQYKYGPGWLGQECVVSAFLI